MIPPARRVLSRGAATFLIAALLATAAACDDEGPVEATDQPAACVEAIPDPQQGAEDPQQDVVTAGPADEVTYLTGIGHLGREGYAHVAAALGCFAAQNIQIDIQPGAGAPNFQQVADGDADFAAITSEYAYQRHASDDQRIRIISAVQQDPLHAVITLESNGIVTGADLVGKTIGSAPGTSLIDLLHIYADVEGWDSSGIEFVEVGDPQALPTYLAQGNVDAVTLFLVSEDTVAGLAGEPAVVLPYSEVLTDIYGAVHITSAELLEQDPDLVERFNTAILQGLDYTVEHPVESGEIMTQYVSDRYDLEIDPVAAGRELELMTPHVRAGLADEDPTGTMEFARSTRAITLMQGAGYVDNAGAALQEILKEQMAWGIIPGTEQEAGR